jgi:hypothetical protein
MRAKLRTKTLKSYKEKPEFIEILYNNEKIVMKNKIEYDIIEDLKLPRSIVKSPITGNINIRNLLDKNESIINGNKNKYYNNIKTNNYIDLDTYIDLKLCKNSQNLKGKFFDNLISPKAKRIETSLYSDINILNRNETNSENKISNEIEFNEKKESNDGKVDFKNSDEILNKIKMKKANKKNENIPNIKNNIEFFPKKYSDKNYFKKCNHAVLGSIADIQLENKKIIENKIKEYVQEYNKQFDDMTFRKKDRKYNHTSKEYIQYLAEMRNNIIN